MNFSIHFRTHGYTQAAQAKFGWKFWSDYNRIDRGLSSIISGLQLKYFVCMKKKAFFKKIETFFKHQKQSFLT